MEVLSYGELLEKAKESVFEGAKKMGLSVEEYLKKMEEKERREEQEALEVEKRRIEKLKQKQMIDLKNVMETYGLNSLKALPTKKNEANEAYKNLLSAFRLSKRLNCKNGEFNNLLCLLLDEFTSVEIVIGIEEACTKLEGFFDMPAFRRFLIKEIRAKFYFMYEEIHGNTRIDEASRFKLKDEYKGDFRKMIGGEG